MAAGPYVNVTVNSASDTLINITATVSADAPDMTQTVTVTPQGIIPPASASATVTIVDPPPVISGPDTVWWFNGQTPSGDGASITLTSSGGSSTTWAVTQGQDKINLTSNGAQATVTSTGTAFSSSVGDIGITATANGQTSAVFSITSRTPVSLYRNGPNVYYCNSTYGYETHINYIILDQLNAALPSPVPLNENWSSGIINDYAGTNWRRGDAGGFTGQSFYDQIQGEAAGFIPTATCNAGDPTMVQHWGQQWYIGSTTPGVGVLVQTNTLQKYIGHADHQ